MAQQKPIPVKGFNFGTLECELCKKNLLDQSIHGNYVLVRKDGESKTDKIYFTCKQDDQKLQLMYRSQGYVDQGWDDIDDLLNPAIWLKRFLAFVNGIQNKQDLKPDAFEAMKKMFIVTFPYVCRNMTEDDLNRVRDLAMFDLL